MITTDDSQGLVCARVFGEFSLSDYKEFEELVNFKIRFEGPVNLLLDLRDMAGFTLDVAWEEIKFTRAHSHDFQRVAVLTDDQWLSWRAWMTQFFTDAEVMVFEDEEDARAWLELGTEITP